MQTGTYIWTHDVVSPLTTTNTEVTTSTKPDEYNKSAFRFEIEEGGDKTVLTSYRQGVRIINLNMTVCLSTRSSSKLPEWGFGQLEINGNKKRTEIDPNVWVIQDVLGQTSKSPSGSQPIHPMSFFRKYPELQVAMLRHNALLTNTHPYQSDPISWPFLMRGISFWSSKEDGSKRQIYLLGNIWGWWISGVAIVAYIALTTADLICRKRGFEPITPIVRNRLHNSAGFFVLGHLIHYVPFFAMHRQLFLHHYLPSSVFAYMVFGAIYEFCLVNGINWPANSETRQTHAVVTGFGKVVFFIVVFVQIGVFYWMRHMIYGLPGMDVETWKQRQLLSGWDLAFLK